MSNQITIVYLIYFLELLEDNVFEGLISLVFKRADFYTKNKTYKELFLNILLCRFVRLPNIKKYDKNEILLDKRKFEDCNFDYNLNEEVAKDLFIHLKIKNSKRGLHEIEDDKEVVKWIEEYNSRIFSVANPDTILYNYIETIILSIDSLFIFLCKSNRSERKKNLNYVVSKIIENKYCYTIEDRFRRKTDGYINTGIVKNILKPSENNNARIDKEFYAVKTQDKKIFFKYYSKEKGEVAFDDFLYLREVTDIKSYKKLNKAIDNKINELNNNIKNVNYCHICCNPYSNSEKMKKHKCSNCEDIYNLIKEIDSSLATNHISSRIKRRCKEERDMTLAQKKERHYKNLKEFIKKQRKNIKNGKILTNVNTNSNTDLEKKLNALDELIDKVFQKDSK